MSTSPRPPVVLEPHPSRRAVLTAIAGSVAGVMAACTSGPGEEPSAGRTLTAGGSAVVPSSAPGAATSPAVPQDLTTVATATVDLVAVHDVPGDPNDPADAVGATPRTVLDRTAETSGQLVFLVLARGAAWLEVRLPVRPNGSTGWLRASDVSLTSHAFAVDVGLGERTIRVTEAGTEVLTSAIGLGAADTPTPGGEYYLKELLQPPTPDGPYGSYAYGLSGFSTVLEEFAGGQGVIGIHGTNRPDLIGQQVSAGCIRLPDEAIVRLVEEIGLPLGTPVTIRA